MMKEILRIIHETGVVNYSEIAETISISQSMVQQAIAVLQSKGYLETVKCPENSNASCAHCAGCHTSCNANQHMAPTFFITEKGKKYLNNG